MTQEKHSNFHQEVYRKKTKRAVKKTKQETNEEFFQSDLKEQKIEVGAFVILLVLTIFLGFLIFSSTSCKGPNKTNIREKREMKHRPKHKSPIDTGSPKYGEAIGIQYLIPLNYSSCVHAPLSLEWTRQYLDSLESIHLTTFKKTTK